MERDKFRKSYEERDRTDERNRGTSDRQGKAITRREWGVLWPMSRDPWLAPHFEMMRQLMGRPFGEWPFSSMQGQPMSRWPPVEMYDQDGHFVVKVELPGLSKEDVKVRVLEDTLIIEGERRSEVEKTEREGFYESEFSYGRFSRKIPLPGNVEPDQVKAKFQNGVLEVSVNVKTPTGREVPIERGT
jgi:HSP20 family molecular chaperone IbpA